MIVAERGRGRIVRRARRSTSPRRRRGLTPPSRRAGARRGRAVAALCRSKRLGLLWRAPAPEHCARFGTRAALGAGLGSRCHAFARIHPRNYAGASGGRFRARRAGWLADPRGPVLASATRERTPPRAVPSCLARLRVRTGSHPPPSASRAAFERGAPSRARAPPRALPPLDTRGPRTRARRRQRGRRRHRDLDGSCVRRVRGARRRHRASSVATTSIVVIR